MPVGEALRRLHAKSWIDQKLFGLNESNPYLRVCYEDLLESNRNIVFKLMEFLRCDENKLREFDYRRQIKQAKRTASDYISNYPELVAAIQRSQFAI